MPDGHPFDLQEQIARIDRELAAYTLMQQDADKRRLDIRFAPWQIAFAGMTAGAAFFGAGFALVTLLARH